MKLVMMVMALAQAGEPGVTEIPGSAEEKVTSSPALDNSAALIQLMNSKTFQGLSICQADPWRGLEYAKNLELDYLRNLLPPSLETAEQQTFRKEISELIIKIGRELQETREKCLAAENPKTPRGNSKIPQDKDADGIP